MDARIPRRHSTGLLSITVALTALFGLSGCAVGPNFNTPDPPSSLSYLPSDIAQRDAIALRLQRQIDAHWWEIFGSAELNRLIEESLVDSPTVRAASARLRQSEAARRAGDAIFFPTLGGDFGATRQLSTPLKLGGAGPGGLFNLYTLSGTVGYALDIFGGQRRTAEALTAAVDYQRMVARATDITLISSVINASVALAGYREQIDASQAILSDYQALVDLTTAQVKAGATSEAALLELRSQLSSQQITLSAIARQAAATEHLLSTLIGREPGADAPNAPELIALSEPGVLPLTVPSTLVRQRPDILAAEAQWHIASADVGITTAALFPTLTLSGTLGQDSTHWPGFSGAEGKFWTGGADISLPLYSGGRSWFGRKAALEAYQAAASDYRQTVLAGLAQVADVLSALNQDHLALTAARDSEASMALTLRLVDVTSRTGASSEASRLYADIAAQSARSNRIGAQARYLQDIVALYVALGGGWWADARISNGKKAP